MRALHSLMERLFLGALFKVHSRIARLWFSIPPVETSRNSRLTVKDRICSLSPIGRLPVFLDRIRVRQLLGWDGRYFGWDQKGVVDVPKLVGVLGGRLSGGLRALRLELMPIG